MHKIAIILLILVIGSTTAFALQRADDAKQVRIANMALAPATLNIVVGQKVTWINGDERDHSVTADDSSFDSGTIGSGQRWSNTFSKVGTFKYQCKYHPRMKGTIVVKEK